MSNPNKTVFSQLIVLFKLAGPIILGNFAFAILGITDMMMAGMAGTPDQAGVAAGPRPLHCRVHGRRLSADGDLAAAGAICH